MVLCELLSFFYLMFEVQLFWAKKLKLIPVPFFPQFFFCSQLRAYAYEVLLTKIYIREPCVHMAS